MCMFIIICLQEKEIILSIIKAIYLMILEILLSIFKLDD